MLGSSSIVPSLFIGPVMISADEEELRLRVSTQCIEEVVLKSLGVTQ
ncbi:MAG: hypothetical protein ACP5NQ_06910 [Vulcanisaeta sp.]